MGRDKLQLVSLGTCEMAQRASTDARVTLLRQLGLAKCCAVVESLNKWVWEHKTSCSCTLGLHLLPTNVACISRANVFSFSEENGLQEFIPLSLLAECLITKIKFCQDL